MKRNINWLSTVKYNDAAVPNEAYHTIADTIAGGHGTRRTKKRGHKNNVDRTVIKGVVVL
jgi:hypothetical protein